MSYPHTYYNVLGANYEDNGVSERKVDSKTSRSYTTYWQRVSFFHIGIAESIADAKAKYPWLPHPILEPVGFKPHETPLEYVPKQNGLRTLTQRLLAEQHEQSRSYS
jgi:hypothetical protein